ncbi:MAG: phage recombination protein Bet [Nitrospiraceae bacterium]
MRVAASAEPDPEPKKETSIEVAEKAISYIPLGNASEITLTIAVVRKFLATRTRSGKEPSDADIVKFMMLCQSRQLDPWQGDAYLIGYDSTDGPTFTLITAHQALAKRSELNKDFDGLESGVIIQLDEGGPVFREGDFTLDGEKLLGGWAKVFRKDRSKPFYQALKVGTYDTQKSRWNKDKAGMIVKCAEAGAYRAAFPTQLGGMYTQEERATIQSAGELPDMAEGKHEFGFHDLPDQKKAEPEVDEHGNVFVHEGREVGQEDPGRVGTDTLTEQLEKSNEKEAARQPEPSRHDAGDDGGAGDPTDQDLTKPAAAPNKADQRFAMLIEHVAETAEVNLDRAEKVALRWLKRFYPKTSMAFQDQRFDTLIWPKAKKVDWKKEAAA